MKILKLNILLLFILSQPIYSQSSLFDNSVNDPDEPVLEEIETPVSSLPDGYRSFLLGMEFEEVKEKLLIDSRFDFRGDPDVSIQQTGSQSLISSNGRSFIDQGFFQFHNERLYLIILNLNQESMDFYTMQQTFTKKYGLPQDLSPQGMIWRNEKVQISLEYPLSLKYLDLNTFESFLEEDVEMQTFKEISRDQFLEDF